ncbi:MAG: AraC family transcriptional regulator, partial [Firmicutes bacterium]|nr:AraC family transcriptional regulator [Bacillota bacterium]
QMNIFRQMNDYHNHHFMIIKIKKYILENFNKDISLQDAANYVNLSPGYFSRFFSGEMGETFTDYIIKLRIEHAKELIKASNFKIYEIAEMVGYENQHYFSRIFKKVTGLTPQQYKSNKGK